MTVSRALTALPLRCSAVFVIFLVRRPTAVPSSECMLTMAPACRKSITTCMLLLCWSCQQCLAFLGSAPPPASAGTQKVQYRSSSSIAFRKHDSAQVERLRVLSTSSRPPSRRSPSRSSSTEIRMLAAPVELWDNYLHALEAAPLLTKVCFGKITATPRMRDVV